MCCSIEWLAFKFGPSPVEFAKMLMSNPVLKKWLNWLPLLNVVLFTCHVH